MKKNLQNKLLEELEKVPIIQVACEKTGISRNTFYKWKNSDKNLSEKIDASIEKGVEFMNDVGESQLLTMVKEKNYFAISFWLKHRHPKYRSDKIKLEELKKKEGLFDLLKRGLNIK